MLNIKNFEDSLAFFKAMASDVRIDIIRLLLKNEGMNMNELASRLKISNGALTTHIRKLETSGIIAIANETGGHGNGKKYTVNFEKVLIDFEATEPASDVYEAEIKTGHFCDFEVYPTCGLANQDRLIGEVDDPRYFAHSDRVTADILWFTKGYIEYIIPNFIPVNCKIDQILISAELSSEAPNSNPNWPSDIYFSINRNFVGMWVSPGDFGDTKGVFSPDWWFNNWNQYGILKTLVINSGGSFIDGIRVSDITIDQLELDYKSTIKLRLEVPECAKNVGGLTIYGQNYGNYNQGIQVKLRYSPVRK